MAQIKSNFKEQLNPAALVLFSKASSAEKELVKKQEAFAQALFEIKEAEQQVADLRAKLLPILQSANIVDENGKAVTPFIENDFVRFSLVRGYNRPTLDTKTLKAVEPKLYNKLLEKYSRTESRRDTVKLTFKKIKVESE